MAKAGNNFDVKSMLNRYSEQKAKFGGGGQWHKIQDGENVLRLLTFTNEEGRAELYVHARTHFLPNVGAMPCLKVDKGDACPICEYVAQLRKRDKTMAGKLAARNRAYFNVLVDGEIKQIEVGPNVLAAIMALFADEDYGNIADLDEGRNIKITKKGSGLNTEYSVLPSSKITSVKLPGEPVNLYGLVPQAMEYDDLAEKFYQHFERLEDDGEDAGAGGGDEEDEAKDEQGGDDEFNAKPSKPNKPNKPNKPKGGNNDDVLDEMFGPKGGKSKPAPASKPSGKPKPKPR